MSLHYVRTKFLPQLYMRGFDGNYYGLKPVKFMSLLLMDRVGSKISRYWPSMKICRRHGYHISDYTIWIDHIDLLLHFNKDIRSPKFICPEDLNKEHNRLVRKRTIERQRASILAYTSPMELLRSKSCRA